jgi:enoyl-CoA hydratase/carnithine racemase
VVAVQGLCFGGGFELAIRSDVIFAGETARFGHPEQSLGIVTTLGGIYRVAERVMEQHGVVNRIVPDATLLAEATAFAAKLAAGPTRARAAHKALLRIWTAGGVGAADEALLDIAMSLFETEDVRLALPGAVEAFRKGRPRPAFLFKGR